MQTHKLLGNDLNVYLLTGDIELESIDIWLIANKPYLSICEDNHSKYSYFCLKKLPNGKKSPTLYILAFI